MADKLIVTGRRIKLIEYNPEGTGTYTTWLLESITATKKAPSVKRRWRYLDATVNQQQMYFLQLANPESRALNLPLAITLRSENTPINISTLLANICCSLKHNEMLRALMINSTQLFTHDINDFYRPYIVWDLTTGNTPEISNTMLQHLRLSEDPPLLRDKSFYIKVVICNPNVVYILVNHHCTVSDRLSVITHAKQILGIWDSKEDPDEEITIEQQLELSPSLVHFGLRATENVESFQILDDKINIWKKMIGETKSLRFSDPNTPSVRKCGHVQLSLHESLKFTLDWVPSINYSLTPSKFVQLAICLTLGTFVGMNDFIVGVVSENRKKSDEKNFIGCYEKILPLRVNFSESPTLEQLISQFKENIQMIHESPLYMIDLVNRIPCLRHKPGMCSPFYVILSEFDDYLIPKTAKIGGNLVQVDIKRDQQFQTHADLIVEVHSKSRPAFACESLTIHYEFSKCCLSTNMIKILHNALNQYLGEMTRKVQLQTITLDYLPPLANLSKWHHANISKTLTPLNLPSNDLTPEDTTKVSAENSIPVKHKYITMKSEFIADRPSIDKALRRPDNLLLGLVAYILCNYTCQEKIGIIYIQNDKVFGFNFLKLSGTLNKLEEYVRKKVNASREDNTNTPIPLQEFNYLMELIPKAQMKTNYLVWCLDDDITPAMLSNDCGIHITCTRRKRRPFPFTRLIFSARLPWFDAEVLKSIVEVFNIFATNINTSIEIQTIPYLREDPVVTVDNVFPHPHITNLNITYINLLEEKAMNCITTQYIAIVHQNEYLTYGYMFNSVRQLACIILDEYPCAGEGYVGVYMHRSPWLYISMFACLKSGRTYVPIGLRYTREHILELVQDYHINLILTESTLLDKLEEMNVEVICIDSIDIVNMSKSFVFPSPPSVEDIMCVQFIPITPSSSEILWNEPRLKVVSFSHMNVVHAINNIMNLTTVDESRVTLASTSVLLDAHIIDSLTPLLRGSCIVIVDDLSCIVPDVTHAFATPSAVCCVQFPNSIASLVVGGETFTDACRKKTRQLKKVTRIYTSPECAVFAASTNQYKSSDPYNIGSITSGYNFNVISNAFGHSVPTGFPGILHLYTNVFAHGPNETDKIQKDFCTGDLVRCLPDQTFQLLCKKENVVEVKEQLFNILPVENALYSFPGVKSACAFVHRIYGSLVAFVVPNDIPLDLLKVHMEKSAVHSYMVPSVILAIEKLPLNEFGRIDKVKLHAIIDSDDSISKGSWIDENIVQLIKICHIFAELLCIRPDYYFPSNNFFARGGNSLLAIALVNTLNAYFNCKITIETLLDHPTPAGIFSCITTRRLRQIPWEEKDSRNKSSAEMVLYVKLDNNCNRLNPRNLVPKRSRTYIPLLNPFQVTKLLFQRKYIEVISKLPGKFYLKYLFNKFDEKGYEKHALYLPKRYKTMSPLQQYYRSYLPMQNLQIILSPGYMHDFQFLNYVPVDVIATDVFKICDGDDAEICDGEDKFKMITDFTNICKKYEDNYKCPNSYDLVMQHARVQLFNTRSDTALSPLDILKEPENDETPVYLVYMDNAGFSMIQKISRLYYGIPSVSINWTVKTPVTSFEELAAYYVDTILKKQPQGPYKLVGRLYGASVAYEIAHQLVAKGHKIELLIMIDDSPVHEKRPALFDPYGNPLPHASLHPAVFFSHLLKLEFPYKNLLLSPDKSLLDCVINVILEEYPWIFLNYDQLKNVYIKFYEQIKCLWNYTPEPTVTGIQKCVLIREENHPFFVTKDFGLSTLVDDPVIELKYPGVNYEPVIVIQLLKQYSNP